ncbi:MAG: tetratricopeptide repeat protein [Acidobacteria bacterium]|nr:tetratricopeptide repeat protein [Acidobacteriota bacterium]
MMLNDKSRAKFFIAILILVGQLMASSSVSFGQSKKGAKSTPKPVKTAPKKTTAPVKTAPKPAAATPKKDPQPIDEAGGETVDVTAPDALERIRAMASQKDRINALEKFIVTQRGEGVQQARELLMREYTLRGEQSLREGNPQNAAQDFSAVLRLAPEKMGDKIFDQYIFPMPVAMSAFGFRAESVELMRAFEKRFDKDANRLVQIGFFYVQIEAPLEAVRILEYAVKLAPEDHRAHNALGNAYLINLRLNDAMAEYEKALELNPKDEFANLNLANLLRSTGDYERAESAYRQHLKLKPDDAEAHGGLALTLYALGREEQAEAEFQTAMKLDPNDYRIPTQLAFFFLNRKKPAQARPLIDRVAHIVPRLGWIHIAKANADLLENKYGDALSTMIAAQEFGQFATMNFELVKMLMAVDGYDQALEVMGKAFTVTADGEFETLLGGVSKARSQRLDLLIERERQAALFLNEGPTTTLQYRLAEALGRINKYLQVAAAAKKSAMTTATATTKKRPAAGAGKGSASAKRSSEEAALATRPRRAAGTAVSANEALSAGRDAHLEGMEELLRAITTFTTLDDGRQAFRMVWAARRLTEGGLALDAAEQLARRALAIAEAATEPDNSMRDAPLLDRDGRRAVFLGRTYDVLGWTLFKKGDTRNAIENLSKSVEVYLPSPERKNALWHLALATEEAGDDRNALEFYIASYEPGASSEKVRKAQIEALYKKLNGSLKGLEERLTRQ